MGGHAHAGRREPPVEALGENRHLDALAWCGYSSGQETFHHVAYGTTLGVDVLRELVHPRH